MGLKRPQAAAKLYFFLSLNSQTMDFPNREEPKFLQISSNVKLINNHDLRCISRKKRPKL
jgi:hypothetical protein